MSVVAGEPLEMEKKRDWGGMKKREEMEVVGGQPWEKKEKRRKERNGGVLCCGPVASHLLLLDSSLYLASIAPDVTISYTDLQPSFLRLFRSI